MKKDIIRRERPVYKRSETKPKKKFIVEYRGKDIASERDIFNKLFGEWTSHTRYATRKAAEEACKYLNSKTYYGKNLYEYRVTREGKS